MSSTDGSTPHGIEPISPSSAYGKYLDSIEGEKAGGTVYSHQSRLKYFVRWCQMTDEDEEKEEIESMHDLRPSHINEWKTWRKDEYDLKKITLKTHLDTLRVFFRWCARNDYVFDGLIDAVPHLSVKREDQVNETWLPPERGNQIKEYVRKYASVEKRAIFELFWATGLRLCSVHSLDVDDFDAEDRYVSLEHRPEQGTTLKTAKLANAPSRYRGRSLKPYRTG